MSDTLIVAISQSGTTNDTNRTVDLARGRGATIISIVNRRNSDLPAKSAGVIYTSDGRDIEMAVASTKAFYAQAAAGIILAHVLAEHAGVADTAAADEELRALRDLPRAIADIVSHREQIREIAEQHVTRRPYWATVGSGLNRIAAQELRIKLSELCYRSIAVDATEDKKHIDLSAEPLIVVCAAGLTGSAAEDTAKEVAIFGAHRSLPIVIVTESEPVPAAAAAVMRVPETHPALAWILATVAGHMLAYAAATAIDAQAVPLRRARGLLESVAARPADASDDNWQALEATMSGVLDEIRGGGYDGTLSTSAALDLALAFEYFAGSMSPSSYHARFGIAPTREGITRRLDDALRRAIDELTRPVDAVKHQAKTVTVGITRADQALTVVPLVGSTLKAGASMRGLTHETLEALAALDPAVERVTGASRYVITGDPLSGDAEIRLLHRSGIAEGIRSRTESDTTLSGTKGLAAVQRRVIVARGRRDGRIVVIVPDVSAADGMNLVLLHVDLHERLEPQAARRVLEGYGGRYAHLRAAVTETEPRFDDEALGQVPVHALLTAPIDQLADHWRSEALEHS